MRNALVIMARYPAVGRVKTRLARSIGAGPACALYRAFLSDLEARFAGAATEVIWAFFPRDCDFAAILRRPARCLPQEGTDLGERIYRCFQRLGHEGFDTVTLIGADCPHLRIDWLRQAEAQLEGADVVLGPSADGGYYLVAMRDAHDIFSGVRMSTPTALADTLRRVEQLGLQAHLLPPTFDVDEVGDLERLRALLQEPGAASELPYTAAALARIP
jgi:rSAM/selenodomain-associated transferase 1